MQLATVTDDSPLTVRLDTSDTPAPAVGVSGYAPAVSTRVLVELVGRVLFVIGEAG